jgi:hypothetical protein
LTVTVLLHIISPSPNKLSQNPIKNTFAYQIIIFLIFLIN